MSVRSKLIAINLLLVVLVLASVSFPNFSVQAAPDEPIAYYSFPCRINKDGNWKKVRIALGFSTDQQLLDHLNNNGRYGHGGGVIGIDLNANPGNKGPQSFGICEDTSLLAVGAGTPDTFQYEGTGGYVLKVKHPNGQVSIYAHMPSNGFSLPLKQPVNEGQTVGVMGCTGSCTGTHVHFTIEYGGITTHNWRFKDPFNSGTPYNATYVSQNFHGLMRTGSTQTVQVQVKNTGTATWDNNTYITSMPRDTQSAFYDPSWKNINRIMAAGTVAPGQTKTFQFVIRAPQTPGDYVLPFGFVQEGVAWFYEGTIWFQIKVVPPQVGENSSRQQAFVEAYNSQGGSNNLGIPRDVAHWWGNGTDSRDVVIQEFTGQNGANDVAIIHDEKRDNPMHSIAAYVIRGDILNYYKAMGSWQSWLGPPTSHQFSPDSNHEQINFRAGYIRLTRSPYSIKAIPWPAANSQWRAQYHNGHNLNNYPTWVQNEESVHQTWMENAPGNGQWGVWGDSFAVRYTGRFNFTEGSYTFRAGADDAIRVWVDGELIIDETLADNQQTRWMTQGQHDIQVNYFELGGYANYYFDWETTPVDCTLSINSGNVYTGQRTVQVRANVQNATHMLVSNDGGFTGAQWQPYQSQFTWTLNDPGSRIATLLAYAKFRDSTGNVLCGSNLIDDIIYDPIAPTVSAALAPSTSSNTTVTSTTLNLKLTAVDQEGGSGVTDMQLSTDGSFNGAEWQPFNSLTSINTTSNDTVYIRVKDSVGNVSETATFKALSYTNFLPFVLK